MKTRRKTARRNKRSRYPMEYISAKTIVTKTRDKGWFGTDYNMNIYKGCCHGCIYCDSRSSCYRIHEFDRIRAKENALEVIRDDLRRKKRTGVVATGSMSDPYNPFEKEQLLTRHALELLDAFGFGAAVATKSTLLTRDIDIFKTISEHSPVLLKITITTTDDELARRIEPGAPSTTERFEALKALGREGLFAGVLFMPVLPFLTDHEENIRDLVHFAALAGAKFIYPSFGVTLRENQRAYFLEHLETAFPGLREKYIKRYGGRYWCSVPDAKRLYQIFAEECKKAGLYYTMSDIILAYKRGYEYEQFSFL